jgi:hypothetical protein
VERFHAHDSNPVFCTGIQERCPFIVSVMLVKVHGEHENVDQAGLGRHSRDFNIVVAYTDKT